MLYEVIMPSLGMVGGGSILSRWRIREGEEVKAGQILFEAESEKATVEIESAVGGRVIRLCHEAAETVPDGTVIAWIETGELSAVQIQDTPAQVESGVHAQTMPAAQSQQVEPRIFVTPVARKIARDHSLDLNRLVGTGPRGRITEADVRKVISERTHFAEGAPGRMSNSQRGVVARKVARSAREAVPVTLIREVDANQLVLAREKLRVKIPGLSYDVLLAWIVAKALAEFRYMNASLVEGEIVEHEGVHIAIAVDGERGLYAPVLHGADRRSLFDLTEEWKDLLSGALAGRLSPDAQTGATFTLTNLGMYGIDAFTPVINLPECAILGIGRIHRVPVERENGVGFGWAVNLCLTFDHRLVDGAPAARFLQRFVEMIEAPVLLIA
jgi:pyruvate dehydrogenase E2 component (dihydrolipoamide acetyltransferase)